MRIGWIFITIPLAIGALLVWWGLFDLGLAPGIDWGGRKSGEAAIIPAEATGYSHAQLLAAGKESYISTNYLAEPTYIPPPSPYVHFEFLASKVDKPYPVFYFTEKNVIAGAFHLEYVVAVKPATLAHILNSAQSLSCATNSGDLTATNNDMFDVRVRESDGLTRRCLVSQNVGCRLLRRTGIYLLFHEDRRKMQLSELMGFHRRMDCMNHLF